MKAQHFPGKEWRVGSEVPGGVELAGASLFSLGGTGGRLGSCGVAPFPRTMGFQSVPWRRLRQIPQIGIDSFPLTEPIQTWYC
jgi:hypothetical protein